MVVNAWPRYQFASLQGPIDEVFAWRPVKLWYGKWVWLRKVRRRAAVVHSYLDHRGSELFWCYTL